MKKKIQKLMLLSLTLLSITTTGCNGNNDDKSNEILKDISNTSVSSVKDAIAILAQQKNYTINVSTKTGPMTLKNNMYYTQKAYYDDYLGDEYGYYEDGKGIYYFDRYNREFTSSSYLLDKDGNLATSLWDTDYICGFSSLELNEFNGATGKTFSSSLKSNKLAFMKMFNVDLAKYNQIKEINLSVEDKLDTLKFTFSLTSGEEHVCGISDVGATKINYLNKQLSLGKKVYTPSSTITKIVDLFSNYNYTHYLWDESYDETNPIGWEKFTENYYINGYCSEYLKTNNSVLTSIGGCVGLKNFSPKEGVEFNGAYYTLLWGDQMNVITTNYYNRDPYIPNVYVYPTFLKALKDTQYFEQGSTDNEFYTNKASIISDFCNNFQLWEQLSNLEVTPVGLYMSYEPDGVPGLENKECVKFSLEYDYYGAAQGTSDFIFTDFNTTKEEVFEKDNIEKYLTAAANPVYITVTNGENSENKYCGVSSKTSWVLDNSIKAQYCYDSMSLTEGQVLSFKRNNVNITPEFTSTSTESVSLVDGKYVVNATGKYRVTINVDTNDNITIEMEVIA